MIALKKAKSAVYIDNRTISLIPHIAKIVAKILRKWIEKKIEDVLEEDQFGFRREIGTRNATGMLKTISGQSLDIDEELCASFRDREKILFLHQLDQINAYSKWKWVGPVAHSV